MAEWAPTPSMCKLAPLPAMAEFGTLPTPDPDGTEDVVQSCPGTSRTEAGKGHEGVSDYRTSMYNKSVALLAQASLKDAVSTPSAWGVKGVHRLSADG